jgi:hypothetical protein
MVWAIGAFAACVLIGCFVFFKNPQNPVNRSFGYLNISLGFWNTGDFWTPFFRDDLVRALWADRITSIGGLLFVFFSIHFYSALAGEAKPSKFARLLINSATPLLGAALLSPWIIAGIQIERDGFSETPGPAFSSFGAYLVWGMLYGVYRLGILHRRTEGEKRIQVQYVLAAFVFSLAALRGFRRPTVLLHIRGRL